MSSKKAPPSFSRSPRGGARRAVKKTATDLVETSFLPGLEGFPLVVTPGEEPVDLASWAEGHRAWIEEHRLAHGAVLFRGFGVPDVEAFREVARAITGDLLDYTERAAPRQDMGQQVYTSTEFPADQWIPLHHEMSYSHNWPTQLLFYCDREPTAGGRTPLVDDRPLLGRIAPEVRRRFEEHGVMYVRNYGEGVDLPWQQAFQTDDPSRVEEYHRRAGASVEWREGGRLRTRAVRQVTAVHPKTGERLWFNHAHMFHSSNLEPAVREALLSHLAPDELPRNAFYGDGSAIEDEVLEEIRRVYREASVAFPWERGDVLLLDNFLTSHGREPFEGPRRIAVAMAELYTDPSVAGP